MPRVYLRFHSRLNRFLPPGRREQELARVVPPRSSIKHVVESAGVPHTEVGLLVLNGTAVDLSHLIQDGDQIEVYPAHGSLDASLDGTDQAGQPAEHRFVLDIHLGKLAAHLRMLGFDTLYRNDYDDAALAVLASSEGRILLTRDRALLQRRLVTRGYYVWETKPQRQLIEVLRRFDLLAEIAPFRRCPLCNGVLVPIAKDAIAQRLQPKTRLYYDDFRVCVDCGQIYWKGSHYEQMQQFITELRTSRPR